MKLALFGCAILLCLSNAVGQYLDTPEEQVPYRTWYPPGVPGAYPNMYAVVDLTEINGDTFLDLASTQNRADYYPPPPHWEYHGYARNNTKSTPLYDWDNTYEFVHENPLTTYTRDVAFGQLRQGQKKDFAVLRDYSIEIHRNEGGEIESNVWQTINGGGTSVAWGAIDRLDAYEDLVVSSGSDIKVYRNLNTGYLGSTPIHTINTVAKKILLAQMNRKISDNNPIPDKLDMVSIIGNTISIHYNSNNNQFDTLQTVTTPSNIWDIAVGDLNNDSWNDVLLTYEGLYTIWLQVFLGDGQGRLSTTATYTYETPPLIWWDGIVEIADMGSPIGLGSGTRNDGWNDIIFAGYYGPIQIFINTQQTPFFDPFPTQSIMGNVSSAEYLRQIKVADVQNTGGHSLVCVNGGGEDGGIYVPGQIYLYKHTGNPAPAPPKNASYTGAAGQHPTITWAPNTERDIVGYNVYKRDGEMNWVKRNTSPIAGNSWTDPTEVLPSPGPGPLSYRYYYATAVDGESRESFQSNQVDVIVQGAAIEKRGTSGDTPTTYALNAAYPNPFNPSTQIEFDLPEDAFVSLNVFDVLGRRVGELANGNYAAGYHSATWNATGVASGVYFARFTATNQSGKLQFSKINKLVLSK